MTEPEPGGTIATTKRIDEILSSAVYREADQDPGFLDSSATRGVRLQLDYLKAELALEKAGVRHTIVVFGSTMIPEPEVATQRHAMLVAELAQRPDDEALRVEVGRAERVVARSRYYGIARELGQQIGRLAPDESGGRVVIMTGGGPGIMEAANRGASDVQAPSAGLNIHLPRAQRPNPYVTPALCFQFHYFAIRKLHLLLRARALVAFPGGFGTLDELFETLTLVQTERIAPLPVILVGREFWDRAVPFEFLLEEGVISGPDRRLFQYAETADEICTIIRDWYSKHP